MVLELLFLFFARMLDMTAATLRHLLVVRGYRVPAAAVGFIEILIYTVALGMMLSGSFNWLQIVVFSAGFAMGIYVGGLVEDRLALGVRLFQVTIDAADGRVPGLLREAGWSLTTWKAEGMSGDKLILHVLVQRRRASLFLAELRHIAPDAFVVAMEPRHFIGGLVPTPMEGRRTLISALSNG